ncbi:MAG: hypothetical protein ACK52I_10445, partial [Pseudomonadota bacterium]
MQQHPVARRGPPADDTAAWRRRPRPRPKWPTRRRIFSSLRLEAPRAQGVVNARMPRLGATAWIHSAAADGGQEALGMRLIDRPR